MDFDNLLVGLVWNETPMDELKSLWEGMSPETVFPDVRCLRFRDRMLKEFVKRLNSNPKPTLREGLEKGGYALVIDECAGGLLLIELDKGWAHGEGRPRYRIIFKDEGGAYWEELETMLIHVQRFEEGTLAKVAKELMEKLRVELPQGEA